MNLSPIHVTNSMNKFFYTNSVQNRTLNRQYGNQHKFHPVHNREWPQNLLLFQWDVIVVRERHGGI